MDLDKEWFEGKTIFSHPSVLTYVLEFKNTVSLGQFI